MDVCDAATGQIITGLLNPDCRDKLHHHGLKVRFVYPPGVCVFKKCVSSVFLTFLDHAHTQTLLKAAVLAAVASPLVHRTVLTGQTHILGVFLHGALWREETGIPIISLQTQSAT